MYGAAYPPESGVRRTTHPAVVILLRVVFAGLSFLSLGLLSWVTLLRVAIMRRARQDWLLFWGSFPVLIGSMWLFQGNESETARPIDYVGLVALFLMACGAAGYYLAVDIRMRQGERQPGFGPAPGSPSGGYGSLPVGEPRPLPYAAPPPNPYAVAEPRPAAPAPVPAPARPPAPAEAAPPPPPRIDRVRAELDELSELLRREQDGR
ncbi:hypothetical protein AB0M28_29010 [Streptomyces sp. NPDC051940]|uniref:hypothetical protein n=1 Tax=Streptomyces sp. NPDC051940 TaxID=3155675 RepID=UPI00344AF73A